MRVVCAPDSFKESMDAGVAAAVMAAAVRRVVPEAECVEIPMADGGEGTTRALVAARGGRLVPVAVRDALGRAAVGEIGVAGGRDGEGEHASGAHASGERGGSRLGVLEVASAVGIGMIAREERDPLAATSVGVADLVRAVLDEGAARLVVGLGGSATNDGGSGLLVGLGAVLRDAAGAVVPPVPARLGEVADVDLGGLDPRLAAVTIELACDVTNPLLGPTGASAVFGPQKGASPSDVVLLDGALATFVTALEAATGRSVRDVPGAGAAGGLGAAFLALGARRRRGVDVVIDAVGLDDAVAGADLVLTGEGSIDEQTLAGKTPAGVAEVAARHGVPVVAFAGRVAPGAEVLLEHGFTAVVPIVHEVGPLSAVLADGEANLARAVATAVRLLVSPALRRG